MASEADRRIREGSDGELTGIPFGMKDIFCTKGIETTCASQILKGFRPPYDATVVKRLNEGGYVHLGRLNMDEFAMGSSTENSSYQVTKNPWDLDAHTRRVERRVCGCGHVRPLRRGAGDRHGRLHQAAGEPVRCGGPQAHLWKGVALRPRRLRLVARPDRADHAERRRLRRCPQGDSRARPHGLDVDTAARPRLRGRTSARISRDSKSAYPPSISSRAWTVR